MKEEYKEVAMQVFGDYFSESELYKIEAGINGISHPLYYLLNPDIVSSDSSNSYIRENTSKTFKIISKTNKEWLNKLKKRLVDCKDYSQSSSALGELRCYGYLIDAFHDCDIKPVQVAKKPTPDFEITNDKTKQKIIVEINTPQLNGEEYKNLEKFYNSKKTKEKQVSELSIIPFGRYKAQCIAENVIHRICAIKQFEKQASKKTLSILWVDFQNEYMLHLANRANTACPIFTGKGIVSNQDYFSNELWYALYAKKDFPIYEGINTSEGVEIKSLPLMRHNGKFQEKYCSKFKYVVFAFPNATVIYENHRQKQRIPDWVILGLQQLFLFKHHASKINFPNKDLKKQIKIDIRAIKKLKRYKLKKW